MELLTRDIPIRGKSDTVQIIPLGDAHFGAAGCDERAFNETVDYILACPNRYTVLMGDLCDCIYPDDKRWDTNSLADWVPRSRPVDAQYERVKKILQKIPSKQILGVLEGNHEIKARTLHFRDITLDLSRELGVPYLAQEALVRLRFSRLAAKGTDYSYLMFVTHGSGGGRKPGAKVNRITELSNFIDADLFLMGHVHEKSAIKNVVLSMDRNGKFTQKERLYCLSGTFLKTYCENATSYGARALYAPTSIGAPVITIQPYHGRLEVTT